MEQLKKEKVVVEEPRDGKSLQDVLDRFQKAVRYRSASGHSGALFLAVHRGKVSEGVDFADDSARGVISVGIPFGSVADPKVAEKRKYNDKYSTAMAVLPGSEWYETQAYRAINQCLGRCVRHKDDWGALLLIDERFCGSESLHYCAHISRWMRNSLNCYTNYPEFQLQLSQFISRLADAK